METDYVHISETEKNIYEGLAADFNAHTGLDVGTTPTSSKDLDEEFHKLMHELEWRRRVSKLQEEVGEIEDALNANDYIQARKELADALVAIFSAADTLKIDIYELYADEMERNLRKSGKFTDTGALIDDR